MFVHDMVYRQTSDYAEYLWTFTAVQLRCDIEKYGHVSIISDVLRLLEILHYFPTSEQAVLGLELAKKVRLDMELALLPPRFAEPIPPLQDKDTITSMAKMYNLISCSQELMDMYGELHRTAIPYTHTSSLYFAVAYTVDTLKSTWSQSGIGYHTRLLMVRHVRDLTK
jgi:hypothetical protein